MRVVMNLSGDEWLAALTCIERRYNDVRRKVLEGDRKGRSIHRYREEALLLARVIEELKHQK
ncbi:hypothetical protein C8P63_10970 [Melghirimyces profundicolus]|uniref:Uncharacterized protein n=1 Tax=Melghirimyces profundicolus TaxID=1242148 RepID=A0A2T6BWA7_9BACL|nr:hypothetical protein [Melghirimyces profundicolus]PTX60306.1 hypothetical protein C8P63_10970 [Melghirimyces profundicolus]